MSMAVILIVMTWMGNYAGPPVVSMQEFSNPDRCNTAVVAIYEHALFLGVKKDGLQAFCVPK